MAKNTPAPEQVCLQTGDHEPHRIRVRFTQEELECSGQAQAPAVERPCRSGIIHAPHVHRPLYSAAKAQCPGVQA